MRFQISLPDEIIKDLDQLAENDHRDPKRQAEWLLCRAIEQAMMEQERTQQTEALEGVYAPAQQF